MITISSYTRSLRCNLATCVASICGALYSKVTSATVSNTHTYIDKCSCTLASEGLMTYSYVYEEMYKHHFFSHGLSIVLYCFLLGRIVPILSSSVVNLSQDSFFFFYTRISIDSEIFSECGLCCHRKCSVGNLPKCNIDVMASIRRNSFTHSTFHLICEIQKYILLFDLLSQSLSSCSSELLDLAINFDKMSTSIEKLHYTASLQWQRSASLLHFCDANLLHFSNTDLLHGSDEDLQWSRSTRSDFKYVA